MPKTGLIWTVVLFLAWGVVESYQIRRLSMIKKENYNSRIQITELEKKLDEISHSYGRTIAQANCNACHGFKYKTDNYLEGVVERVGEKYLILYLTKQDSLIAAKDPYAVKVKIAYGNLGNSHNFKFSRIELKAIIDYMR